MITNNILKFVLVAAAVGGSGFTAGANLIDFGTSWPVGYTAPSVGPYSAAPYNALIGVAAGNGTDKWDTETQIKDLLNSVASTTFTAADIHKTDHPAEVGGSNGYFSVPAGWEYLVVQYDGKHGGSLVIDLNGNEAKVPFDSAGFFADSLLADKYAVSHWSVAGSVSINQTSLPDSGATLAMLGGGLTGLALFRRRLGF